MRLYVVGLSGRAGVGKSTFATALADGLRQRFRLYARIFPIAGKLKRAVYASLRDGVGEPYGISRERGYQLQHSDVFAKPMNPEMRQLLQEYGSFKSAQDHAYWVKEWLYEVLQSLVHASLFIVDDVRFEHERSLVRGIGHVHFLRRAGFDGAGGHQSERLEPDVPADIIELGPLGTREYQAAVDGAADRIVTEILKMKKI